MVSNATYPALDAERPASQSRAGDRRAAARRLGYEGVVITDDLGAGALTGAGLDEGEAAVGAARRRRRPAAVRAHRRRGGARGAVARRSARGELDRGALIASCARADARCGERLAG